MKTILTTMKKTEMRFKGFMMLYVLLAVITTSGILLVNRLTGEISEAAVSGNTDIIFRLFVFVTGITVLRAVAAAANTVLMARYTAMAGYKLRGHFVNYFLRVPFASVEKAGSGESLSIYSNDIPNARNLITHGLLAIFEDFIAFVSAFVFMLFISPAFTGILFLAALLMLVMQFLLSRPLQSMSVKVSERQAEFTAVVNDSLQNLPTVAAYSLDEVLEERYMTSYRKYFTLMKKFAWFLGFLIGAMMAVMLIPLIVVFVVLALGVIDNTLSLAEFVAFVTTIMIAAGGILQLGQNVSRIAQLSAGAKRLNDNTTETLESEALESEALHKGHSLTDTASGAISFKDVSFAYAKPTEESDTGDSGGELPLAVNSASFHISPGSKVAIVGSSGSGKSTILKLLLGLYEPTKGEIQVSGKNIASLAKTHLRNIFAYVPQDSFLFPESIAQNIMLEPEIKETSRLQKACTDAGILDFINSLPNKFDTNLSEAADNISGGQRQRIALARAFYKDAPIILFDEATSSLDPTTEAAILASFEKVAAGKTVIMVAHRANAIATCDSIIVMDGGKVSAMGTHEALVESSEIYRNLYQREVQNEIH